MKCDLQDHPLEEADWTLHADGSSYMDKGNRKTGYVVVILEGVVEAEVPVEAGNLCSES